MQYTPNYNMTIAEGSDVVNPLTQIFPNFSTIDTQMKANEDATVGAANEVTTGSVHAITRTNANNAFFRFTATSAWSSGDTMTVDGSSVTVHTTSGETLPDGAYVIGAEVVGVLVGSLVTLLVNSKEIDSLNVVYGAGNVKDALDARKVVLYDSVGFSIVVSASGDAFGDVSATIPAGYTIASASVLFTNVNAFITYDLATGTFGQRLYLHNNYTNVQTITGSVLYTLVKT